MTLRLRSKFYDAPFSSAFCSFCIIGATSTHASSSGDEPADTIYDDNNNKKRKNILLDDAIKASRYFFPFLVPYRVLFIQDGSHLRVKSFF